MDRVLFSLQLKGQTVFMCLNSLANMVTPVIHKILATKVPIIIIILSLRQLLSQGVAYKGAEHSNLFVPAVNDEQKVVL